MGLKRILFFSFLACFLLYGFASTSISFDEATPFQTKISNLRGDIEESLKIDLKNYCYNLLITVKTDEKCDSVMCFLARDPRYITLKTFFFFCYFLSGLFTRGLLLFLDIVFFLPVHFYARAVADIFKPINSF